MVSSLRSSRGSEKVYIAVLLICFCYILITSPFGRHAQSIVRPLSYSSKHNATSSEDDDIWQNSYGEAEDSAAQDLHGYYDEAPLQSMALLPDDELDTTRMSQVEPYVRAIMNPKDTSVKRLQCPKPFKNRYQVLNSRHGLSSSPEYQSERKRYYFALNLYQSMHVLPRLMASVIEAMRKLGPTDCVLSIVGGRSNDGTTELLSNLRDELENLGVTYYLGTSDIDPFKPGHDRVMELARLRNMALAPLFSRQQQWSSDATVVFINDVAICTDDILELIYQKQHQHADMVCAMDWSSNGQAFYDSWVSRGLNGDIFVEITQSANFEFAHNVFWNDPGAQQRVKNKLPTQVFACWNGATAFRAEPLLLHNLTFRASYKGECYAGEPTLLCKDLWNLGYGRIAIIPSVNVGYDDEQSKAAKENHGYASLNIEHAEHDLQLSTKIKWKKSPPELVRCQPDWTHSSWEPWNQGLADHIPFDWTRSGFFNAKRPLDKELEFESDDSDVEVDEKEFEDSIVAAAEAAAAEPPAPETQVEDDEEDASEEAVPETIDYDEANHDT